MATGEGQVLMSVEAEAYIDALEPFDVKDIGSQKWSMHHEYIEKLNMQAVMNASAQEDEFVKEFFITAGKIPVLIHEVIATEIWKQKVFPELIEMNFDPKISFPIYMVLYHEATIINLLETIMYHKDACESAEESILDLLDYCYRKLTALIAKSEESDEDDDDDEEVDALSAANSSPSSSATIGELQKQNKTLDFDICIKSVSVLRYIIDNLSSLPLSVMQRLLNTHDVPILLVQLVENPPWTKRKHGKLKKYVDNKWQEVSYGDSLKLTKIEGQMWIALFQLLMNQDCQQKYDLSSYRKNVIIKLRSYLTEVVLDQMPVLSELQRFLEHLSMMDPPPAKKDLVLEQIPEIREKILTQYEGKWKKLAKKQSQTYFNPSKASLRDQAKRWVDTYNFDVLESLITEPPKCAVCGADAAKRCSRCQNEWYCRRECQVGHWKKHKAACDLLYDSLQKLKETEGSGKEQTS
ncbi:zinc finger MYND domain-containing protein 10 [Lingula anatina]|uniref:Zinc finger MYND domain-containing protein 10 n=1 Tax=Lingula anatina TaxID=7574 RepID=A0A1S3K6H8_LINAN|nr:zinc finger MYND domain-containing protein 10 [Lingula anatina]|eukprot:XP_013417861.1 zinc finger MYND domain-containing protein 10 [Lingula anatina]